jgi:hypothetical protein
MNMKTEYTWILIVASVQLAYSSDLNIKNIRPLSTAPSNSELLTNYNYNQSVDLAARQPLVRNEPSVVGSSEPSSLPACPIDTSDISELLTAGSVQILVERYGSQPLCAPRLHSAFESIFREEERNEGWARPLERIVKDATEAVHAAKFAGGCHRSLCRYDIELTPSTESARSPNAVDHRVIEYARGTPYEVESVHYGSTFKYRVYFYSTVVPAAFVEPLRKKMADGH